MTDADAKREMTRLRFVPRLMRSLRKRYIQLAHGDEYFVTSYFGARFLVRRQDMVAREIALHNFEGPQLEHMKQACIRLRPDMFIDIGANIGLYSCVLLKNKLVPRALLFEPDRRNFMHLQANLLINRVTGIADCRPAAVGAASRSVRFMAGPESNTGTSKVVEDSAGGYEVEMVRLDNVLALSGSTLAMKLDIEGYELNALAGMQRTLRENRGIVQIETTTTREQVIELMRKHGYEQTSTFYTDVVFEKS